MKNSSERVFSILFNQDEVTWQSIIYDLVKNNEIDPWDVDISLLASKYLVMLKKLKEMDFRISGKVLLAAAVLLKIKSNRLMSTDITNFENMFKPSEETLEEFISSGDLDEQLTKLEKIGEKPYLIPRTPQPRERKVTIFDLVDALQQALDVKKRRIIKELPDVEIRPPQKTREITEIIKEVYGKILAYFAREGKNTITFEELTPSGSKSDKISTFIPLLHLDNQRKVDMMQEGHFMPITVKILEKKN
jgi:segregation and condensation protein A